MELIEYFKKHLDPCELSKKEIELIQEIQNHFTKGSEVIPKGKGFTLSGGVGVGKTTVFKIIQWSKIHRLPMYSTKEIINDYDFYLKKITGKPVIIDDLGEETLGNDYGRSTDFIGDLISRKYEEWKYQGIPTYFTTNNIPQEIEDKYGLRVYERYKEMQTWVKYPNPENKRGKSKLIPLVYQEEEKKPVDNISSELDKTIDQSIKEKKNLLKYNTKGSNATYYMVASIAYRHKAKETCKLTKEEKKEIFKESCGVVKVDNIENQRKDAFKEFDMYLKKQIKRVPKDNKYYKLSVTRAEAKAFEIWLESKF